MIAMEEVVKRRGFPRTARRYQETAADELVEIADEPVDAHLG